jgi:hypothetical protein
MERQTATTGVTGEKFFGISVLEGMSRWDFFNLYGATFFVGILIIIPAIIQPAFLKEVIGIPRNEHESNCNPALHRLHRGTFG